MTKYLILYRSSSSARDMMSQASPEEAKAGMDAWMTWAQAAGPAVVDLGSPLAPNTATPSGTDQVGGFSILEADSPQALEALLADHPHKAQGGTIESFEFLAMPGM